MVPEQPLEGAGFFWCGGDTRKLALHCLVDTCFRHGDVGPLRNILERTKSPPLAAIMVRRAFPTRRNTLVLPKELADHERSLLQAVALCNTVMDELFSALNARGFVTHRQSLERFSGGSSAGPLDRVVDGVPLWKHARDVMSGEAALTDLLAAWSALSPEETLAACEDALTYYMSLQLPFPAPSHADGYQTAVGFGRLTELCAKVMGARVGKALLEERLRELDEQPKQANQRLCAALLAAYLARGASDDELGRFMSLIDRAITSGTELVLRDVISHLEHERRAELLLSRAPAAVRVGSGYVFHGSLPYLDLVATPEAARVAINALSTLHKPPVDRLVEIITAIGVAAMEPIEQALGADPSELVSDALVRARDAIARQLAVP